MHVKDRRTLSEMTAYVMLAGTALEPRNGVSSAQVQFSEDEKVEADSKRSLGALVQIRPTLLFGIGAPVASMSRLIQLAAARRIHQISLACMPTGRGKALVHSWSVSTKAEE
jgi:hypothetical protein